MKFLPRHDIFWKMSRTLQRRFIRSIASFKPRFYSREVEAIRESTKTNDYNHLRDLPTFDLGSSIAPEPFTKEIQAMLSEPVDPNDVEIKPDGIIYVPEISITN